MKKRPACNAGGRAVVSRGIAKFFACCGRSCPANIAMRAAHDLFKSMSIPELILHGVRPWWGRSPLTPQPGGMATFLSLVTSRSGTPPPLCPYNFLSGATDLFILYHTL